MKKCNCGDKDCKREIKGTSEGKLYVINHFTCGKVKEQIKQIEKQQSQNSTNPLLWAGFFKLH